MSPTDQHPRVAAAAPLIARPTTAVATCPTGAGRPDEGRRSRWNGCGASSTRPTRSPAPTTSRRRRRWRRGWSARATGGRGSPTRSQPGRAATRRGTRAGHRQPRGRRGRTPHGRGQPTARRPGPGSPARRALLAAAGAGARHTRRGRGAVEPDGHPPRRHGGGHVVPVEGVPQQPLPLGLLRPLPQQLGSVVLGAGLREPHEGAGVPAPANERVAMPPRTRPRPRTRDETRPAGRRRRRARDRSGGPRRVRERRRDRLDHAAGPEGHVLPGGAGLVQRRRRHGQPLQPGQPGRRRRGRPSPLLLPGLGRARRHLHLGRLGRRPGARHGQGRPPRAADEIRATLATGKDAADKLPDRAYEYASVQDGTLFVSNEKSRAIAYRTLDQLRGELGAQVVPRGCGRQTEPVTLPVVTPP